MACSFLKILYFLLVARASPYVSIKPCPKTVPFMLTIYTKDGGRFTRDIKQIAHRKLTTGEKAGLVWLRLHDRIKEDAIYDIWRPC